MEKILDRIIILICCSIFLFSDEVSVYTSIPIIVAIAFSSFFIAIQLPAMHIGLYVVYLVLCYFFPPLIHFLPLMCYDLFCESYKYVSAAGIIILYLHFDTLSFISIIWVAALILLTFLLKTRTSSLLEARTNYYLMHDDLIDQSLRLQRSNRELLERQDYEVTNATLNERNRIAREIHDTVGHLISSSLLQIGALLAISKDETTKESLTQVKDTLSTGMDSIRSSIHNIHDESLDLNLKLNELISNFTFCPVKLNYNIENDFSAKTKYTIVFIIKETLSNIMKHSNATFVSITFTEFPSFYRIIIEDNGKSENKSYSNGMGLISISDRIDSLGGTIRISNSNGFRVFVTLPKK